MKMPRGTILKTHHLHLPGTKRAPLWAAADPRRHIMRSRHRAGLPQILRVWNHLSRPGWGPWGCVHPPPFPGSQGPRSPLRGTACVVLGVAVYSITRAFCQVCPWVLGPSTWVSNNSSQTQWKYVESDLWVCLNSHSCVLLLAVGNNFLIYSYEQSLY